MFQAASVPGFREFTVPQWLFCFFSSERHVIRGMMSVTLQPRRRIDVMLTRPGKSEGEVEAEVEARDVASVIKTPYISACVPT